MTPFEHCASPGPLRRGSPWFCSRSWALHRPQDCQSYSRRCRFSGSSLRKNAVRSTGTAHTTESTGARISANHLQTYSYWTYWSWSVSGLDVCLNRVERQYQNHTQSLLGSLEWQQFTETESQWFYLQLCGAIHGAAVTGLQDLGKSGKTFLPLVSYSLHCEFAWHHLSIVHHQIHSDKAHLSPAAGAFSSGKGGGQRFGHTIYWSLRPRNFLLFSPGQNLPVETCI